jgi:enterochelin esterase-like enzyme
LKPVRSLGGPAASLLSATLVALPASAAPPVTKRPGAVKEYSIASRVLGSERRLWVYSPPGYAADGPDLDLLLVFDGGVYLEDIPLPRLLDDLIAAKRVPPTLAVMVDNGSGAARLADLANRERFVEFVVSELVPWVRSRWKATTDPHRCTVTGSSAGGLASAFVALRHPELFGNVLSQSGAFWRGAEGSNEAPFEWLRAQYAATPKREIRFLLEVGGTETRGAMNGAAPSILEANRRLRDTLRAKGYEVSYTEVPGGTHSPESWRDRLPAALVWIESGPRRTSTREP